MAKSKPVWYLEKQVQIAKKKAEVLAAAKTTLTTTVNKRKTDLYIYTATNLLKGAASELMKLTASAKAVEFFGGFAALGLQEISSAVGSVGSAPRHFTPAKVHAMVGAATPVAHLSKWGTRVIKYSTATTAGSQSFYSSPICSSDATSTYAKTDAKATVIYNAIKAAKLGDLDYARFYLTQEQFTNSKV
jgi:hypothetical protein